MKKLFLLISLCTLTFISCDKDDDSDDVVEMDALIGTWNYFKSTENGVDEPLDACDMQDTLIFNADGSFSEEYFYEDDGNCMSDAADTGTWTNKGNNVYSFLYEGETDADTITLAFQDNTFYVEYTYDNETPGDTSDDIVERVTYIRQ